MIIRNNEIRNNAPVSFFALVGSGSKEKISAALTFKSGGIWRSIPLLKYLRHRRNFALHCCGVRPLCRFTVMNPWMKEEPDTMSAGRRLAKNPSKLGDFPHTLVAYFNPLQYTKSLPSRPTEWSKWGDGFGGGGDIQQPDATQIFLFSPIPAKARKLGLLSIYKFSAPFWISSGRFFISKL